MRRRFVPCAPDDDLEVGVELPGSPLPLPTLASIFTAVAAAIVEQLNTAVGMVSLVDNDGQTLLGSAGLSAPWAGEGWLPLSHSFCRHIVTSGVPLVVTNANDDPLVRDSPAIMELGIIAYAGMPLSTVDGIIIGAICAFDHFPHAWSSTQLQALETLASTCTQEIHRRSTPT